MFSTPPVVMRRTEALWGAVYFETKPSAGGVMMQLGLGSIWTALLLLSGCIAACLIVGGVLDFVAHKRCNDDLYHE